MSKKTAKRLYLPASDRSFWKLDQEIELPLLYLAWGRRNFKEDLIPVSMHEGWVYLCIQEGCPVLMTDTHELRLSPKMFVIIGPDTPFGWKGSSSRECRLLLWMWQKPATSLLIQQKPDYLTLGKLSNLDLRRITEMHDVSREEIRNYRSSSRYALSGVQLILESVFSRTLKREESGDSMQQRCQLALAWMRKHIESHEPIARLCDYMNVSQSTLHRIFTHTIGKSPAICFQEIKMQQAREQLDSGKYRIKEIAFTLGYKHFNDFSRAYKKHFGHAPTQR